MSLETQATCLWQKKYEDEIIKQEQGDIHACPGNYEAFGCNYCPGYNYCTNYTPIP